MTELTFLEVFFPKAQIQAHSAGTVKLARDHWLSTYCPMTGPTFPTRAKLIKNKSHVWLQLMNSISVTWSTENVFFYKSYADRRLSLVSFRANMCTVPLSLDAQRKDESWLKLMLEKIVWITHSYTIINGKELYCMSIVYCRDGSIPVECCRVSSSPEFH